MFLLISGILAFRCQPVQKYQNTTRAENLNPIELNFKYLSAKGRLTYQDANTKTKANIYVRMRKDSLIWLSARLAGVEGLRMVIRKDSVFILDRQEKKYYAHNYLTISEELNFRVNYNMIQALLIADDPYPSVYQEDKTKIARRRNFFVIKQDLEEFTLETFISRFNMRNTKIEVKEKENPSNKLAINYTDFQEVEKILLPHITKANVNYTKNQTELITTAKLEFSKVELPAEPLKFPFVVSAKYLKQ